MDIEKLIELPAPPAAVWPLLLDPQVMGECVPGMQGIEVVSPTEYLARMTVKIAFITASFRIRTVVLEQEAPRYLKTEGTGDDAAAASSFRQKSEIYLEEADGGRTRMRVKVRVDLLGRLGTFGLNVMKTKADRIWDEFGANLSARLTAASPAPAPAADHPGVSGDASRGDVPGGDLVQLADGARGGGILQATDRKAGQLARALHWIAALMLAGIVLINLVNVAGRYLFSQPIESADELMMFLLSSALFLSLVRSTHEEAHIRMDLMRRAVGPRVRRGLDITIDSLVCVLCLVIAYAGAPTVMKLASWGQVSDAMKLPMWMPHSMIPIGFGLAGLVLLLRVLALLRAGREA